MNRLMDILCKYSAGESTLEEVNQALREAGADLQLDPQKNTLTEAEKCATTIGYYARQANGFGLLDTGTGSLDKVEVRNGRLVNCDCGNMHALCLIIGKAYPVQGDMLTD